MTAPFPLYLMRHGEPELSGRLIGRTDCAATARGIADCVAQASTLTVATVITSDLRRAAECARAVSAATTPDPRWRELDFGEWDGLSTAEIDPNLLGRFWADPDGAAPPGGENWSSLVARVRSAIADMPPQPTLVVTHGGAIRAALAVLCGFTYPALWSFDLPCSVVVGMKLWPGPPPSAQIVGIWP